MRQFLDRRRAVMIEPSAQDITQVVGNVAFKAIHIDAGIQQYWLAT